MNNLEATERAAEADGGDATPRMRRLGRRLRSPRGLLILGSMVVVFAGAVVATLLLLPQPEPPPSPGLAKDVVTLNDNQLGVSMTHPASWRRVDNPADPADGVVVQIPPANGVSDPANRDAMTIRKVTLEQSVDKTSVRAMRAVTDAVLSDPSAGLTILATNEVTVGGLPGVYYLYTFPGTGGRQGVHAHYFLFHGRDMYMLVLQAFPASEFGPLAPTFDAVVGTLRAHRG